MRNVLSSLFVVCLASFMLWASWLLWQDYALAQRIIDGELDLREPGELEALPPFVLEPLRRTLFDASRRADNHPRTLEIAQEYIERRPLDAEGWLWASQFALRQGDEILAAEYLGIAHQLSRRYHPMLRRVFNRYLETGLTDQAVSVAHDLALANPSSFRNSFYILSRLTNDYDDLVSRLIPENVPTFREFPEDMYYRRALDDARRLKNTALAEAVWSAMPGSLKAGSRSGLSLLNYLASQQNGDLAYQVWQDLTVGVLEVGSVENAGFEGEFDENIPCWQTRDAAGAKWSIDSNAYEGEQSLLVEFTGDENTNYHHLSCLVFVEPGKQYELTGMWAGRDISTLSGPYVEVHAPGVRGSSRIEAKIGTWPWMSWSLVFDVPDNVSIMNIRIRRARTDYLDSKIAGRVWFDDFNLKQLAEEPAAEITDG